MTDPASPAAVTEERIEEIRETVLCGNVHCCGRTAAFVDLLAAYDARGLELARRDEEVARLRGELEALQSATGGILTRAALIAKADATEARLAQANEALGNAAPEEPMEQDEQGGCVWCGGGRIGDDIRKHKYHDTDCAWLRARLFLSTSPTPPAQSAGEALDPAGTGEDLSVLRRRLTAAVHRGEPLVSVSQDELARLLAQASALAGARRSALEEVAKLADRRAEDALHGGDGVGTTQPGSELRGFVSERLSDFADEIRANGATAWKRVRR